MLAAVPIEEELTHATYASDNLCSVIAVLGWQVKSVALEQHVPNGGHENFKTPREQTCSQSMNNTAERTTPVSDENSGLLLLTKVSFDRRQKRRRSVGEGALVSNRLVSAIPK